MRIINMNAIFLIFIGTIVRFTYFKHQDKYVEHEESAELGEEYKMYKKETESEIFMFYFSTIVVFPALITLYVLVELEVKQQ